MGIAESVAQTTDRKTIAGPVFAEVVKVRDGDTVLVRAAVWPGQTIEVAVRIRGIDAPERRARCGREKHMAERARRRVRDLLGSSDVTLHQISGGKYFGRVLARLESGEGVDIGGVLVDEGLAVPYARRKSANWCATLANG